MKFQIEWTSNVGLANDVLGFVSFHAWSYRRFKNNEKYFFNLPSTENWFIYLFCETGFNNFHEKISQKVVVYFIYPFCPQGRINAEQPFGSEVVAKVCCPVTGGQLHTGTPSRSSRIVED